MIFPEKDIYGKFRGLAQYDAGFVAYLGFIFDPSRPVIDVGANVGKVAIFLASRTAHQVICYEPSPASFLALKENTKNFTNITRINKAVSDHLGVMKLVGDGTVQAHLSDGRRGGNTVDVIATTLDDSTSINCDVGLIKVDVEGWELSVLQGAAKLINRTRPLLAVEIINEHLKRGKSSRQDIFKFLNSLGYKRAVNKYGMTETSTRTTGASDVFFLPDKNWYAPNLRIGYERILKKQNTMGGALKKPKALDNEV